MSDRQVLSNGAHASQDNLDEPPPVGSRVTFNLSGRTLQGYLAFSGDTQFSKGEWHGVVLDEPLGKNDGSVQGIKYFECSPMHGLFLRPGTLTAIDPVTHGNGMSAKTAKAQDGSDVTSRRASAEILKAASRRCIDSGRLNDTLVARGSMFANAPAKASATAPERPEVTMETTSQDTNRGLSADSKEEAKLLEKANMEAEATSIKRNNPDHEQEQSSGGSSTGNSQSSAIDASLWGAFQALLSPGSWNMACCTSRSPPPGSPIGIDSPPRKRMSYRKQALLRASNT